MTKKYELIDRGTLCYRIKALIDIPRHGVKAGDLGGLVENENNLSQKGQCWIEYGSVSFGNSRISADSLVRCGSFLFDNAQVGGFSIITNSRIRGDSLVQGRSSVTQLSITGASVINTTSLIGHLSTRVADHNTLKDACVKSDKDYLMQGPALSSGNFSLAYRTISGSIQVSTGCFHGTLDEYLQAIEDTHKNNPEYLAQYKEFHQNFVKHFSQ